MVIESHYMAMKRRIKCIILTSSMHMVLIAKDLLPVTDDLSREVKPPR